ncbi:MAG: TIGR03987 family protein [Robiginitomaculum sp.]|nr:MAG: TIGR03987 family protein [Robiginitomaculum sp.]
MPTLLLISVILFTVALVFYTWGVWSEFRAKYLARKHVVLFALGVSVDTLATILTYLAIGGLTLTPHSILGFVSLALMTFHLFWAILARRKGNTHTLTNFHKLSLLVWSIWMASYISGFVLGMAKMV